MPAIEIPETLSFAPPLKVGSKTARPDVRLRVATTRGSGRSVSVVVLASVVKALQQHIIGPASLTVAVESAGIVWLRFDRDETSSTEWKRDMRGTRIEDENRNFMWHSSGFRDLPLPDGDYVPEYAATQTGIALRVALDEHRRERSTARSTSQKIMASATPAQDVPVSDLTPKAVRAAVARKRSRSGNIFGSTSVEADVEPVELNGRHPIWQPEHDDLILSHIDGGGQFKDLISPLRISAHHIKAQYEKLAASRNTTAKGQLVKERAAARAAAPSLA